MLKLRNDKSEPIHPGLFFRHEYRLLMEPLLTQTGAARKLHWSVAQMRDFELGRRGVTAEKALALADLTGESAEFWLSLQVRFDLWHAIRDRKRRDRLKRSRTRVVAGD
ncbi:MAG: HigA family addiction module antitoxin [Vicinamibacterales bacterium]